MTPYIYYVDWWDYSAEKAEKISDQGLVFAENLAKATQYVGEYFGENDIAKITLVPIGDGTENILDLTKEQAEYFEANFA